MSSDDEFDLVMPFVVCRSKGGPYDDHAYVAGFEAGRLDMALTLSPMLPGSRVREPMPYHSDNIPQLDLIAMRHGVRLEVEDHWEGWSHISLQAEEE